MFNEIQKYVFWVMVIKPLYKKTSNLKPQRKMIKNVKKRIFLV